MTIKKHVSQLMKRYKTNDPFEIASQKGILVLFEELGSALGYFNLYKRIKTIHINCNLDDALKRFVCAHELGHALLHPDANTPFLKKNTFYVTDKIEREANTFAVELLMPDQLLYDYRETSTTTHEAAATYGIPHEVVHLKKF